MRKFDPSEAPKGYKAVESMIFCGSCALKDTTLCIDTYCTKDERKDNTTVNFIKIEEADK